MKTNSLIVVVEDNDGKRVTDDSVTLSVLKQLSDEDIVLFGVAMVGGVILCSVAEDLDYRVINGWCTNVEGVVGNTRIAYEGDWRDPEAFAAIG